MSAWQGTLYQQPIIMIFLIKFICFQSTSYQILRARLDGSFGIVYSAGAKGSWVWKMWGPQSVDSFELRKACTLLFWMLPEGPVAHLFFIPPPLRYQLNGLKKCFGTILMVVIVTIFNCFFWLKIIIVRQLKIYIKIKLKQ